MSLDGDLLFSQSDYPQSDYFPELNNDNTAFDEADFEKDLFGPATSGLSEHSGVQVWFSYGTETQLFDLLFQGSRESSCLLVMPQFMCAFKDSFSTVASYCRHVAPP